MAFVSILLNKRKIFPKTDWNIVNVYIRACYCSNYFLEISTPTGSIS